MYQLDSASLHLAVRLSPYKSAIINAITNEFAWRYYHTFTWLVAYSNSRQTVNNIKENH